MARVTSAPTLLSLGHSTLPLAEFMALLAEHDVRRLVDVRRNPVSRRHPHFGRGELERSLPAAGIEYAWEGDALGGRRRPRADSPHVAMRRPSSQANSGWAVAISAAVYITSAIALVSATVVAHLVMGAITGT